MGTEGEKEGKQEAGGFGGGGEMQAGSRGGGGKL